MLDLNGQPVRLYQGQLPGQVNPIDIYGGPVDVQRNQNPVLDYSYHRHGDVRASNFWVSSAPVSTHPDVTAAHHWPLRWTAQVPPDATWLYQMVSVYQGKSMTAFPMVTAWYADPDEFEMVNSVLLPMFRCLKLNENGEPHDRPGLRFGDVEWLVSNPGFEAAHRV